MENQEALQYQNYLDYLRVLEKNGMVTKIQTTKIYGTVFAELFEVGSKYFAHNNGILLYYKGRMINRHGTEFGTMLDDCFFKKRYKKPPYNIWKIVGVIEMNEEIIKVNLMKTKLITNLFYHKFIKDIRMVFEKQEKKNLVASEEL